MASGNFNDGGCGTQQPANHSEKHRETQLQTSFNETASLEDIFQNGEADEPSEVSSGKRCQSSSQVLTSSKKMKWEQFTSSISSVLSGQSDQDDGLRLKMVFSRITWALEYLKHNKLEIPKDYHETICDLCCCLKEALDLSDLQLSNSDCRYLLRLVEITNNFIVTSTSSLCRPKIADSADMLLGSLLNHLAKDKENSEALVRRYALVSSIVTCIDDEIVRKCLVEMLLLRVASVITNISEVWFSLSARPNKLCACPGDINLFFYYAQLLEVVLTYFVWTEPNHEWMVETVVKTLRAIETQFLHLFMQMPNFLCVLFPSINVANKYNKKRSTMLDTCF